MTLLFVQDFRAIGHGHLHVQLLQDVRNKSCPPWSIPR